MLMKLMLYTHAVVLHTFIVAVVVLSYIYLRLTFVSNPIFEIKLHRGIYKGIGYQFYLASTVAG